MEAELALIRRLRVIRIHRATREKRSELHLRSNASLAAVREPGETERLTDDLEVRATGRGEGEGENWISPIASESNGEPPFRGHPVLLHIAVAAEWGRDLNEAMPV